MQKLFNVDKWTRLIEGDAIQFANPKARNVRLEVNAPVETALYYIDTETGETYFLALVKGRDTLEFGTIGPYSITLQTGECSIYTADGTDISQTVVAPVIFTKIMERRRRNPELEYIAATMQRNMERRLEQQAVELENLFARRAADAAALAAAPRVPDGVGSEPAPSGRADPPSTPLGPSRDGGSGIAPAAVSGTDGEGGQNGV